MRKYALFVRWFAPSVKAWKEQLAIGVPMGLSVFFEASIFAVVTLMMGMMFNTVTVAAHQAAINFTSLLFMIPLSISMALTIVVGFEVGGKRFADAKQYSRFGVLSAVGLIAVASVFLYFFRGWIAGFYTDNPEVITWVKQFLIFAIFYQLSDAAQASLQGVLRGYKDVTIPFITALISYWGIGIPVGYGLASFTALGPFGFWLGITIGLTCAFVGFLVRLLFIQKRIATNLPGKKGPPSLKDRCEPLPSKLSDSPLLLNRKQSHPALFPLLRQAKPSELPNPAEYETHRITIINRGEGGFHRGFSRFYRTGDRH